LLLVNVLAFYSSTVFSTIVQTDGNSYLHAGTALFFSLGVGVINFIFAWPAFFYIDKYGRRPLLLTTVPLMFLFLLIAGLCTMISDKQVAVGVVVGFLYLFVVVYSPGMGPIPFTYSAEVFPITHREIGMSWAVSVSPAWNDSFSDQC
jgi:MFS family permease